MQRRTNATTATYQETRYCDTLSCGGTSGKGFGEASSTSTKIKHVSDVARQKQGEGVLTPTKRMTARASVEYRMMLK
jgi:hypothetical protein